MGREGSWCGHARVQAACIPQTGSTHIQVGSLDLLFYVQRRVELRVTRGKGRSVSWRLAYDTIRAQLGKALGAATKTTPLNTLQVYSRPCCAAAPSG